MEELLGLRRRSVGWTCRYAEERAKTELLAKDGFWPLPSFVAHSKLCPTLTRSRVCDCDGDGDAEEGRAAVVSNLQLTEKRGFVFSAS